jgi:cytochrome b pre-mRNA-processing protein 3
MMFRLFRRSANRAVIERLSGEIVAAARHQALFAVYGIEDSIDGRFEALALHAALVLRRLGRLPEPGPEIAQELADSLFRSLDAALREKGVGDLSVPKHMKMFASAFIGRANAYDLALNGDPRNLAAALLRNVYGGKGRPDHLARYVSAAAAAVDQTGIEDFLLATITFPQPDTIP